MYECSCLWSLSEKHDKVQLMFFAVNFSCRVESFWSINKKRKEKGLLSGYFTAERCGESLYNYL